MTLRLVSRDAALIESAAGAGLGVTHLGAVVVAYDNGEIVHDVATVTSTGTTNDATESTMRSRTVSEVASRRVFLQR